MKSYNQLQIILSIFCLLSLLSSINAQGPPIAEVCNNGIDDDLDGFIDLNDSDCECLGFEWIEPESYIYNHSGEILLDYPISESYIFRAEGWSQLAASTADLFYFTDEADSYNGLGFGGYPEPSWMTYPPANGSPIGSGYFGYIGDGPIGNPYSKEWLRNNTEEPLVSGVAYTFDFLFGFGTVNDLSFVEFPNISETPTEVVLYGCTSDPSFSNEDDCFYIGGNPPEWPESLMRCPTHYENSWIELGRTTMEGVDEWVKGAIHFTVPEGYEVNDLVWGDNCGESEADTYYYMDHFLLNESLAFNIPAIAIIEGDPCFTSVILEGNMADVSYQWYKDGIAIEGATEQTIDVSYADYGNYSFLADNGTECMESVPFALTYEEYTPVSVNIDTSFCNGGVIIMNGANYNLSGTYIDTAVVFRSCDTVYNLTLEVFNHKFTDIDTFLCFGEGIQFGDEWINEEGLYTKEYTSYLGCDSTVNLTLLFDEEPIIGISGETELCKEDNEPISTVLTVFSNYPNIEWSNGSTNSIEEFEEEGIYTISATSEDGCLEIQEVEIIFHESPLFDIELTEETCINAVDGSLIFTQSQAIGTPPFEYSIDNGETYQSSPTFSNLPSGNYNLLVTDAHGCQWNQNTNIQAPNPFNLGELLEAEYLIGSGDSLYLDLSSLLEEDNYNYLEWSPIDFIDCPTCPEANFYPTEATNYSLIVNYGDNCTQTEQITVNIINNREVYIPNTFSPNNDNINDRFTAYGNGSLERIISMQIFNRHGNKIFEIFDIPQGDENYGWDGTYKEELLNTGVYIYLIEVEFRDGTRKGFQGDITIFN